jgi:hypothetical protein
MSGNDHFILGEYNAACAECGRKFKASQLKRHWKGYYVCPDHWEPRHPQDFVRAPPAEQPVPWSQPQLDTYVENGIEEPDPYVPPDWNDPTS